MPGFVAADVRNCAVLKVLPLFRQGLRPIGNFAASLDDALPRWPGAIGCVDFGVRSWLRFMILNIPVGRDEGLPDAIEVGMTVGHMRSPVGRKLSGSGRLLSRCRHLGQEQECKDGCRGNRSSEPVTRGCNPECH